MSKNKIKYWLDKSVDYIIGFFAGGGAMSLGFLDHFPITFIYMFGLVAFLIGLMIKNQWKDKQVANSKIRLNNNLLLKLTEKDILNALGGKYEEERGVFLFQSRNLIASVAIDNYYTNFWGEEFRKIYVNFIPSFVKKVKCIIHIGWNGVQGSYFKGKILIYKEDSVKEIAVDDLSKKSKFEIIFEIKEDIHLNRYIEFSVDLDQNLSNDVRLGIRECTKISLTPVSFKLDQNDNS
jgi:hypothetical protein